MPPPFTYRPSACRIRLLVGQGSVCDRGASDAVIPDTAEWCYPAQALKWRPGCPDEACMSLALPAAGRHDWRDTPVDPGGGRSGGGAARSHGRGDRGAPRAALWRRGTACPGGVLAGALAAPVWPDDDGLHLRGGLRYALALLGEAEQAATWAKTPESAARGCSAPTTQSPCAWHRLWTC